VPKKAWLVGVAYVQRELTARRGAVVHINVARDFTIRKGFPKRYYTRAQAQELALWWSLWDRELVDAFIRRTPAEVFASMRLDPEAQKRGESTNLAPPIPSPRASDDGT
jgi:hypothetical protein